MSLAPSVGRGLKWSLLLITFILGITFGRTLLSPKEQKENQSVEDVALEPVDFIKNTEWRIVSISLSYDYAWISAENSTGNCIRFHTRNILLYENEVIQLIKYGSYFNNTYRTQVMINGQFVELQYDNWLVRLIK